MCVSLWSESEFMALHLQFGLFLDVCVLFGERQYYDYHNESNLFMPLSVEAEHMHTTRRSISFKLKRRILAKSRSELCENFA